MKARGDTQSTDYANRLVLDDLFHSGNWVAILDMCTAMFEYFGDDSEAQQEFRDSVNELLVRYYSAYRMADDGSMYEPGSVMAEMAIEQARSILISPKFGGPDRQFQEALIAFHRAVNPSYETAVAEAIKAVEGVAKILVNDPSLSLGKALRPISEQTGLPLEFRTMIDKLYQFGSENSRHGAVGESVINRTLAEYVLTISAGTIVLFARLYGVNVNERGETTSDSLES